MRKRYTAKFKAEIVQEVLQENKTIAEIASEHGIHPNQINRWKAMALKGLPSLFSDETKAAKAAEADHEEKLDELYAEIGRLTTQLTWLKKNLASTLSRTERLALVERENSPLPLATQCDLLSLNRSGLYLSAGAGVARGDCAQACD